jgi:putative SOS response-associated peptidase YedK
VDAARLGFIFGVQMCGRFALYATSEELSILLKSPFLGGFKLESRFNAAPGQWIIIVRPEKGQRAPALALWGLVPSWAKDPGAGPRPINARAEGISTKPTFRGAFRHGRCLIPASGFYEWKTTGKTKVPHFIRPAGEGIFVFAGLESTWAGPDGELTTCTIITTEPNALMAGIHNRMPVILGPDEAEAWLDPSQRQEALLQLLRPCPAEGMEAFPVATLVNNVRNDGRELVLPVLA